MGGDYASAWSAERSLAFGSDCMGERITEEVLQEIRCAESLDEYLDTHSFAQTDLPQYLEELLRRKGLKRSRVVRMADLNDTFGYQIFCGQRHASRNKLLQICFAMALDEVEANRVLRLGGAASLNPKIRREAIIVFCLKRGTSLQKVNEELYRLGEDTIC